MGAAFTAGLLFAVILIPINKYIAGKIGQLSEQLMSRKDERVLTTSEVLHGARQIKLNAWEEIFIKKIEALRSEEVIVLAKRKYLDALCVYFWATTPVLMCLLTFGVAALTGQEMSAATIYTSVALLNMLIGPLNSFPWVLNGLMEAWVSLKRVQELIDVSIEFVFFMMKIKPTVFNFLPATKYRSHRLLSSGAQSQVRVESGQTDCVEYAECVICVPQCRRRSCKGFWGSFTGTAYCDWRWK